jgi:predicted membrane protein
MSVVAAMGGVELDLRQAELVGEEPSIRVTVAMGGVQILVPQGVEVDAHDVAAIMGGRDVKVPEAPPGAPRIRIHGVVVMGGLEVRAI